nr:MAG TPA: hypothetical protein [Caudoviricetes sp.]
MKRAFIWLLQRFSQWWLRIYVGINPVGDSVRR